MANHAENDRQQLSADDAKVFELLKEIEGQYERYLQITAQTGIIEAWADVPPRPISPDMPLSLTLNDPQP
jgi:hypothetical protein